MKKILILDVDSCYFCPCSSAEVGWLGNITRSLCQVKGEENTVFMDGVSGMPKWCPLKPMPNKRVPDGSETDQIYGCYVGWNACLEELEK